MARPGRFERPTSGSGDQRSIQLSYGRAAALFETEKRETCKMNGYEPILAGIPRMRQRTLLRKGRRLGTKTTERRNASVH